jgi:hypothetical protein
MSDIKKTIDEVIKNDQRLYELTETLFEIKPIKSYEDHMIAHAEWNNEGAGLVDEGTVIIMYSPTNGQSAKYQILDKEE